MIWIALLALVVATDFAWVAKRARREWSVSDDLSTATALSISTLYVLVVALVGAALALRPWPIDLPLAVAIPIGGPSIVGGLVLAVVGARPFGGWTRLYGVEVDGLIEGGVYALSRNPQYAGLICVVAGVAVVARSSLTLAVAAYVATAFWIWVVTVEEPHLARTFGVRYSEYRERVPRFFGVPRRTPR